MLANNKSNNSLLGNESFLLKDSGQRTGTNAIRKDPHEGKDQGVRFAAQRLYVSRSNGNCTA